MTEKNNTFENSAKNVYNDGNTPEIDVPKKEWVVEPLPESTRPRKDGPGGEDGDQ